MADYKLDFVKIEKSNLVAGVGTAGNIWIVLNALLNIEDNDRIYIDMTKEKTVNTEDELINGSNNPWEYYFDQIGKPEKNYKLFTSVNVPPKLIYSNRYTHLDKINKELKNKFFKNFKLKKDLEKDINNFYIKHIKNKNTLGVQIRLTDMASAHNVKAFSDYVKKVNKILNKDKTIEQIFLATDDEVIIEKFIESVNLPVIFLEGIYRATKEKPDLLPYDRLESNRTLHKYKLGKEVILDVFILSKCNQILKADISCVSHLAVFFSTTIVKTHFVSTKFELFLIKIKNKLKLILKDKNV